MIKFADIKARLTGISCPFFGISWTPPQPECATAKKILRFLEDRRVLYVPSEMEVPDHCVHSVVKIREFLTCELQALPETSELFGYVKAMRIACRKFLERMQCEERDILTHAGQWGHYASWHFASALGEMRGTFGNMVAQMVAAYGLDVESDLASILPGEEKAEHGEKQGRFRDR